MASLLLDLGKEYSQTVRTEILWRVAHRDHWLKVHLVAQIAVFAFANGFDLGFVRSNKPIPGAAAFAFPVSLTLAIFYFVEDRLVGLLSKYVGALARAMPRVDDTAYLLAWDTSPQLSRYVAEGTLLTRFVGQFLAFLALPATIVAFSYRTGSPAVGVTLLSVGCGLGVLFLTIWSYHLRRTTGLADADSLLVLELPRPHVPTFSRSRKVLLILLAGCALMLVFLGLGWLLWG